MIELFLKFHFTLLFPFLNNNNKNECIKIFNINA